MLAHVGSLGLTFPLAAFTPAQTTTTSGVVIPISSQFNWNVSANQALVLASSMGHQVLGPVVMGSVAKVMDRIYGSQVLMSTGGNVQSGDSENIMSPIVSGKVTGPSGRPVKSSHTFEVIKKLGEGGFGVAYLAKDTSLGVDKPVVIKILKDTSGPILPGIEGERSSRIHIDTFLGEAKALGIAESHPMVPSCLLIGECHSKPAFVMQHAHGPTLKALKMFGSDASTKKVPVRVILEMVAELSKGLYKISQISGQNLCHRDIKPENIILTSEGLKVIDWGIATGEYVDQTTYTQVGMIAGSQKYIAPERLEGESSHLSDVYSLGCIIQEWLFKSRDFALGMTDKLTREDIYFKALRGQFQSDFSDLQSDEDRTRVMGKIIDIVEAMTLGSARIDGSEAYKKIKTLLSTMPGQSLEDYAEENVPAFEWLKVKNKTTQVEIVVYGAEETGVFSVDMVGFEGLPAQTSDSPSSPTINVASQKSTSQIGATGSRGFLMGGAVVAGVSAATVLVGVAGIAGMMFLGGDVMEGMFLPEDVSGVVGQENVVPIILGELAEEEDSPVMDFKVATESEFTFVPVANLPSEPVLVVEKNEKPKIVIPVKAPVLEPLPQPVAVVVPASESGDHEKNVVVSESWQLDSNGSVADAAGEDIVLSGEHKEVLVVPAVAAKPKSNAKIYIKEGKFKWSGSPSFSYPVREGLFLIIGEQRIPLMSDQSVSFYVESNYYGPIQIEDNGKIKPLGQYRIRDGVIQ